MKRGKDSHASTVVLRRLFIKIYFMFLYYSLSKFFETIYGFSHAQILKMSINNDYNSDSLFKI